MNNEQDPDGDVLFCWYADESALPDIFLARLRINTNGSAEVLDCDGVTHSFESINSAKSFLSEDEYLPFHELKDHGLIPDEIKAPPPFLGHEVLQSLMKDIH